MHGKLYSLGHTEKQTTKKPIWLLSSEQDQPCDIYSLYCPSPNNQFLEILGSASINLNINMCLAASSPVLSKEKAGMEEY